MSQFRDTVSDLSPPWLREGDAERYMYTLALCTDILLDMATQANEIRLPGIGDPSNLPWLAHDRVLVQGPLESNASFATRLQNAFAAWKKAGSAASILGQLQAYLQGLQPGVAATLPAMTIVGGNTTWTKWTTTYQGDAVGAPPTLVTTPANWNWDGHNRPWRAWLILYMSLVATGNSGSAASIGAATGTAYGTGAIVNGVVVPNVATPINTPFLAVSGLAGAAVGQWLTLSGSAHAGNDGTFPIVSASSPSQAVIANPNGVAADAGPLTWSTGTYPFIGPGAVWGAPGVTFGQGELQTPPKDTGALVGGIAQPTALALPGSGPSASWGLSCPASTIAAIRALLTRWKRANTYYPDILVAFDGGTGIAGSAFSPYSSPGAGNPDGTFGGRGKIVNGVAVPNRIVSSPFDAWCQGTGSWPGGGAEVS